MPNFTVCTHHGLQYGVMLFHSKVRCKNYGKVVKLLKYAVFSKANQFVNPVQNFEAHLIGGPEINYSRDLHQLYFHSKSIVIKKNLLLNESFCRWAAFQ
jgi:hypothetical protein